MRGVTVEIDQQLNPIAANAPGDILGRLQAAINKVLGRLRDALSECAHLTRQKAVGEDLDARAIDTLQAFDQQMPDGMIAKVRGDESHSQARSRRTWTGRCGQAF